MVSFSDWFLWDLRLKREGALGELQEGQREAGGAGSLKGARKAIFQVGLFLKKKSLGFVQYVSWRSLKPNI